MKYVILVLAVIFVATYASTTNPVCELWRGWGESFAGNQCSTSIETSCVSMFDVITQIIQFIKTMNFTHLIKLIGDIFNAVKGLIAQFIDCKYFEYLKDFIPHLIRFFQNIGSNIQKIQMDLFGFISSILSGNYYQAGIFLGNISKIIIAS